LLTLAGVTLELAWVPAVAFCLRWRTTLGASAATGDEGALSCGVVEVSVGVIVVVEVELVDDESLLLASGLGAAEVDVVVGVVEEPVVLAGVLVARAPPASGPPRPAMVNPPPARAQSTACRIRRRALISGGMRCNRFI